MKYDTSIKNLLGLTQQEMAMVLQITISQWSMYKSGMRDIPVEAKNKLASLLQHLKEEKGISEERHILDKDETQKTQEQLQQNYRSVQIKQHQVAKKISIIENTRNECFAALQTAAFLESQEDSLAQSIRSRVAVTLSEHTLYRLTELRLKEESLQMQKKSISQKLQPEKNIQ